MFPQKINKRKEIACIALLHGPININKENCLYLKNFLFIHERVIVLYVQNERK